MPLQILAWGRMGGGSTRGYFLDTGVNYVQEKERHRIGKNVASGGLERYRCFVYEMFGMRSAQWLCVLTRIDGGVS